MLKSRRCSHQASPGALARDIYILLARNTCVYTCMCVCVCVWYVCDAAVVRRSSLPLIFLHFVQRRREGATRDCRNVRVFATKLFTRETTVPPLPSWPTLQRSTRWESRRGLSLARTMLLTRHLLPLLPFLPREPIISGYVPRLILSNLASLQSRIWMITRRRREI